MTSSPSPAHVHEIAYRRYRSTCESCGAEADAWCNRLGHRCARCFVRDEYALARAEAANASSDSSPALQKPPYREREETP